MLKTLSLFTLALLIILIVVSCESSEQEVIEDSGAKASKISENDISTTQPEVEITPTPISDFALDKDAQRITLEGIAGNSKRSAALQVGDDRYYLDDLHRWPSNLVGKLVRVEGTLRIITIPTFKAGSDTDRQQMMGDGKPMEINLLENTRIIDE